MMIIYIGAGRDMLFCGAAASPFYPKLPIITYIVRAQGISRPKAANDGINYILKIGQDAR